jgi:hypothetical protein
LTKPWLVALWETRVGRGLTPSFAHYSCVNQSSTNRVRNHTNAGLLQRSQNDAIGTERRTRPVRQIVALGGQADMVRTRPIGRS